MWPPSTQTLDLENHTLCPSRVSVEILAEAQAALRRNHGGARCLSTRTAWTWLQNRIPQWTPRKLLSLLVLFTSQPKISPQRRGHQSFGWTGPFLLAQARLSHFSATSLTSRLAYYQKTLTKSQRNIRSISGRCRLWITLCRVSAQRRCPTAC